MKKILIFLLIPLIITDETDEINKINMLIAKATIEVGMGAISKFVDGGEVIAGFLSPIVNSLFKSDEPDPNEKVLKEIDSLRKEIMSRLEQIEKELIIINNNILDTIKGTIYINGFGSELNHLRNQIEDLVSTMTATNNSKTFSKNEKIVENAYTIGSNKDWMNKGHIILNLKNLADTLAGQSFSDIDNKDLYQIVYDSFAKKRMFSGEAYDDSDYYIEKVMNIYFYGCSVIIESLRNTLLMCNFTDRDIESLSPLIKNHYYSTTVGDSEYVTAQIKYIANKVFDIRNKDSVVSHYLIFKYKKKYWRNIFINLGQIEVTIANQIRQKEYAYPTIEGKNEYNSYEINSICNEIKSNNFVYQGGITPQQMSDLYDYFLKTYKNNTRFEFLSFLLDKGINVSELLDERYEINFFAGNSVEEVDEENGIVNYKFTLLHSDKVDTISNSPLYNSNALMTKGSYSIYTLEFRYAFYVLPYPCGVGKEKRIISILQRGEPTIVPSTAEEIINLINNTEIYNNSAPMDEEIYGDSDADSENPQIIILGFSNYTKNDDNYTYNNESKNIFDYDIHIISLNENIRSITMFHSIIIKYKNKLRNLDDEEIFSLCMMNEIKDKKYKASCIVPKNDSEIDNIEVIPDFNFSIDDNITIKMSSLANKQKNNINNLEKVDYSSYNIYVLENAAIIKNENLLFSINGIINENITNINNTDLILTLNNNTNETCEVKCQIINIIDNNYTLNCESNENINTNLDSSISIINNNSILLITFTDSESNLELKRYIKPRYYFKKSDKGIGAGAIALIVIIPILAIISVIAFICFAKKDNKNIINENGTIRSVNALNK